MKRRYVSARVSKQSKANKLLHDTCQTSTTNASFLRGGVLARASGILILIPWARDLVSTDGLRDLHRLGAVEGLDKTLHVRPCQPASTPLILIGTEYSRTNNSYCSRYSRRLLGEWSKFESSLLQLPVSAGSILSYKISVTCQPTLSFSMPKRCLPWPPRSHIC
jgi:hypothetical protein